MQLELKREREHEASLKTAAEKEVASLKERLADMEAHANARWVVGHADLIMFIRLLEPVLVGGPIEPSVLVLFEVGCLSCLLVLLKR